MRRRPNSQGRGPAPISGGTSERKGRKGKTKMPKEIAFETICNELDDEESAESKRRASLNVGNLIADLKRIPSFEDQRTGVWRIHAECVDRVIQKYEGEQLPEAAKGGGEKTDYRALSKELYEALNEVERVAPPHITYDRYTGRAIPYCLRCLAEDDTPHEVGCSTGIALNKAEALLNE